MADAGRGGERQRSEADGHDEASERHLRGPERQHDARAARALAQAGQAAGQRGGARRAETAGRRHSARTPLLLPSGPARRPSSPRVRGKLLQLRGWPPREPRGLRRQRAGSGPGRAGSRAPAAPAGARAHAAAAAQQGRPPAAPRCALSRPPGALPSSGAGASRRRRLCPRARAPPPRAGPGPGPELQPGPSGAGTGWRRCGPSGWASALAPLAAEGSGDRGRFKGEGGRRSPGPAAGKGPGSRARGPAAPQGASRRLAWGRPGAPEGRAWRGGGREDVNSERSVPGVASRSRSRMRNSKIQNFCSSRISQGTTENSALEGSAFRILSSRTDVSCPPSICRAFDTSKKLGLKTNCTKRI